MRKRFRAAYVIAIGFAAVAFLALYGYPYANNFLLGRDHFPPLVPGNVNIVGLDTSAGYGILVENRAAKLVFAGKDSFGPGKMDEGSLQRTEGDKKFIPIKEMLKGLQGDVPALSYFIQRLNSISDDDLSAYAPVWKAEDIDKALDGDPGLHKSLVHDLNVELDGTPLDRVTRKALTYGIIVDTPVPMQIQMGAERKTITARVKRPFKARFLADIEGKLASKFMTDNLIGATYSSQAQEVKLGTTPKENVAGRLKGVMAEARQLGERPQVILDSISPVINENQMTGASYSTRDTPKGKNYTLIINVSDEGKKRLWQFSRDRVGSQLLVTVDGVAIAAPFIEHRLSGDQIEIGGLEDESLAQLAVEKIKQKKVSINQ